MPSYILKQIDIKFYDMAKRPTNARHKDQLQKHDSHKE